MQGSNERFIRRGPTQQSNAIAIALAVFTAVEVSYVSPTATYGWGDEGHQTIGAIADVLVRGSRAEQEIRKLLTSGESLSTVTTWADCAKYCPHKTAEMQSFVERNPQHHDYHFTDIPYHQTEYTETSIGAGSNDVVHIVEQAVKVLLGQEDPIHNPHRFSRREALLLLAHLVGDIHQPLHVGTAYIDGFDKIAEHPTQADIDAGLVFETYGDNYLLYNVKKLHGFWDSTVVKYGMKMASLTSPSDYAAYLLQKEPGPLHESGNPRQWAKQWAAESLHLSKSAHEQMSIGQREEAQDPNGNPHWQWHVTLPHDYTKKSTREARHALVMAGKRLAFLLKTVWPE